MSKDLQQHRDSDSRAQGAADVDVDAEHDPEVARRASNAGLRRAVQMKAKGDGKEPAQVHDAAQRGAAGAGSKLPHYDKLQTAFGEHDISQVKSHVDASATGEMGAQAYATGDNVVFDQQPDLHTAAHEAAHVVQQRKGVSLAGGVGKEGDSHEQHADQVADKVVRGESVQHMLGPATASAAPAGQAVQRKPAEKAADPKAAHDTSDRKSFDSVMSGLRYLAKELHSWGPQLDAQTNSDTSTEAGAGPASNAISSIFERAKADITHVGEMILVAKKDERRLLSSDVKLVLGAFSQFSMPAQRASHWMKTHGYGDLPVAALQHTLDGYTSQIQLDGVTLDPDRTVPEGDEKALSKTMVSDQFVALGAALDSVKAGNEADAGRITMHTRYLGQIATEHAAELKAHKPQLKTLLKELTDIRQSNPAVAERLSEAEIHIRDLLK